MKILPNPEDLNYLIHQDPDGYRFEIRLGEDEAIYEESKSHINPKTCENAAKRWIKQYSNSNSEQRCKLCVYDWDAVKQHLKGAEYETL